MLYLKASKTTPSESLADKLHVIKQGLELLSRRYHVARMCRMHTSFHQMLIRGTESYLSLISRREIMQAME